MKRFLTFLLWYALAVLAIAIVAWCVCYGMSSVALSRAAQQQWPSGLGTLTSLPSRHPTVPSNAAAQRLLVLARPLAIDFRSPAPKGKRDPVHAAISNFVTAAHTTPHGAIDAAPAPVTAYLTRHAADIDAVRDHLMNGEIVWATDLSKGFDAPLPNLLAYMQLTRVLVARALVRAREGDAAAWRDLEAAWRLDRSLLVRPELITQMIALAIARIVNGAAWRLPLPAPAWLRELSAVDHPRLFAAGLQHDTWLFQEHGQKSGGLQLGGPVGSPYVRVGIAGLSNIYRETAGRALVPSCWFDGKAFFDAEMAGIPKWNAMARIAYPRISWDRAHRYKAEREAVANALRLRAGAAIEPSRCSDARWIVENTAEGGVRLSLHPDIPGSDEKENVLPLSIVIKP